jgi:hypothetical protein
MHVSTNGVILGKGNSADYGIKRRQEPKDTNVGIKKNVLNQVVLACERCWSTCKGQKTFAYQGLP